MGLTVFIPKETEAGEARCAASPETVRKLIGLGLSVIVEKSAGDGSRVPDAEFEKAGAAIGKAADIGKALATKSLTLQSS